MLQDTAAIVRTVLIVLTAPVRVAITEVVAVVRAQHLRHLRHVPRQLPPLHRPPQRHQPKPVEEKPVATPVTTTVQDTVEQQKPATQNTTSKPTINNGNYIFSLGDRTLQVGCIGTDVKVLAALLQKHGFIEASDIETNAKGYVIYNKAIAEGVKKFQKVAKLPVNSIADKATITALRNYGK